MRTKDPVLVEMKNTALADEDYQTLLGYLKEGNTNVDLKKLPTE